MPRKAKIICTLGPSSYQEETLEALINAGMNNARLNFSHGSHDFYHALINRIRHVASRLQNSVAILQDLQGPKIRVGKIKNNLIELQESRDIILSTEIFVGDREKISCSYENLIRDVGVGDDILLDDGRLVLVCHEKDQKNLYCKIKQGGVLKSNKGINLPNSATSVPSLTKKDLQDLAFGAHAGVDAVALSFVRSADDILKLRAELAVTKTKPLIFAKLEKQQALDNLDDILQVSDGVMVARGDLGVEVPPENVPLMQKKIIERALFFGKAVIVATEMLESMTTQIRPTRAEASDVANAVLDGADMLMLSGETAAGAHPVEAVAMMRRIIKHVEASTRLSYWRTHGLIANVSLREIQNNLCLSAVSTCETLKAAAIVMFTNSGASARLVSAYRPRKPIIAFVPNHNIEHKLSFCWGVRTEIISEQPDRTSELLKLINNKLLAYENFSAGDKIVVLTKMPLISKEHTNTIHVHTLKPM